jgi:A/G-specific adenine glycosylase
MPSELNISIALQNWFLSNARDLPWRADKDPYKIWLSEIILQQTQVIQGTSYFLKFIDHYPKIKDLASAPEDEVLKLWQGLGYYSRARNLHVAAKQVMQDFNGQFPKSYQDILTLKGVGPYTAAAIASIAYNEKKAVVDGNVYRVLARLFNISIPIDSTEGKKTFQILADELIDGKQAGNHNQAMMELGATVCKPVKPLCDQCPVHTYCLAHEHKNTEGLPVKAKKIKTRDRFLDYIVIEANNEFYFQKRLKKDIWQNLYEFYLIEHPIKIPVNTIRLEYEKSLGLQQKDYELQKVYEFKKHVLTHQHLHSRFHHIKLLKKTRAAFSSHLKPYGIKAFKTLAFPRLIDKFVKRYLIP